ncbi:hypothetical protein HK096_009357, partial [Nowakowskiella sp. JEL0078]
MMLSLSSQRKSAHLVEIRPDLLKCISQNKLLKEQFLQLIRKASRILTKAYSEFYPDEIYSQTPGKFGSKANCRQWKSDSWRMPVQFPLKDTQQNLILLNIREERLEVHTVAQQGTTCPESYIFVSHIWNQALNDARCYGQPRIERVAWALAAVEKLSQVYIQEGYPDFQPYNYVWLDLFSIDQSSPEAILSSTYLMSHASAWADTTVVLMYDETHISTSRWFKRVWTFQESFFSHYLAFYHQGECYTFDDLETDLPYNFFDKQWIRLRTGIFEARDLFSTDSDRQCYNGLDKFYAVTTLLPYLSDIKPDYDLAIDQLKIEVAKRALEYNDTSLTQISGDPKNVLLRCAGGFLMNPNGGTLNATKFDETLGTTIFYISSENLIKQKLNHVEWGYKLGGCESNLKNVLTRCGDLPQHNMNSILIALCGDITEKMREKQSDKELVQNIQDANNRMIKYNLITRTTEPIILNYGSEYLTVSSTEDLNEILKSDLIFILYSSTSNSSFEGFDTYL